jgi:hypothetical protein
MPGARHNNIVKSCYPSNLFEGEVRGSTQSIMSHCVQAEGGLESRSDEGREE